VKISMPLYKILGLHRMLFLYTYTIPSTVAKLNKNKYISFDKYILYTAIGT
jgi:hypothetical protein